MSSIGLASIAPREGAVGLRVAVVDSSPSRRREICSALVGDPRVGVVTGIDVADATHRLARLGADLIVVGEQAASSLVRAVAAVRAGDGEAQVTVLGCEGMDVVATMLAGADRLAPACGASRSPFVWRELLLSGVPDHASNHAELAANGDGYRGDRRPHEGSYRRSSTPPRLRLALVFGVDGASGLLSRLALAARHYDVPVVASARGHRGLLPSSCDGARVRPGRLTVVAPGDRLVRSGEALRVRCENVVQPLPSDVVLVDAALDAVGPGVGALCLGLHQVSPVARWRLRNDGAFLRRAADDQLEHGLHCLLSPDGSPGANGSAFTQGLAASRAPLREGGY